MTKGQALANISEAIIEGSKILTKIKDLLTNEYPVTDMEPLENGGKINFNFYWAKLFLKFQLSGDYRTHVGGGGESILFEYPLIWGRYDYDLEKGIEIEKQIVKDSKIRESPGIGSDLVYGEEFYSLERIDKCLLIINQIIYKCLPDDMKQIENIEWTE